MQNVSTEKLNGNLAKPLLSPVRVFKGDCLEVMKSIPNESIDAIITDPPYGTTSCKWDSVINFSLMWEQLNRIIKPNGVIVLFGSEPFSSTLRISNIKDYKYDWVWKKTKQGNFAQAPYMPLKNTENICVFAKGSIASNSKVKMNYYPQGTTSCSKINNGGNKANEFRPNRTLKEENHIQTTTNYPKQLLEFDSSYDFLHPTQKPILLMEYLVKTYTKKNELVLDFTAGSGTTGIACINTNRNCILIEKEQKYFDIINERIAKHTQQRAGEFSFENEM
jgi:site-specific DNA-methyltransferase (adenine-specific)